jgi:hypothetical protein
MMSIDPKSHYYDVGGIETIKIIKAKLSWTEYIGYLRGNILRYACRCRWKGSKNDHKRDAEKMEIYSRLLFEELPVVIQENTDEQS